MRADHEQDQHSNTNSFGLQSLSLYFLKCAVVDRIFYEFSFNERAKTLELNDVAEIFK